MRLFVCLGFHSGHHQVKTEREQTRSGPVRYVSEDVNGLRVYCSFSECFFTETSESPQRASSLFVTASVKDNEIKKLKMCPMVKRILFMFAQPTLLCQSELTLTFSN